LLKLTKEGTYGVRTIMLTTALLATMLAATAPTAHGDMAYGVGFYEGYGDVTGIFRIDTAAATAGLQLLTPGLRWYGATDGLLPHTFFAVANPGDLGGSQLFLIDSTFWNLNPLGSLGVPIAEIAMDESTGTLYGTDYLNLYTIPTGGGPAVLVGPFGPRPVAGTGSINNVWSMDYDPSIDQLVGASWLGGLGLPANDKTDLYYFDRATGTGTFVGPTNQDRLTDIWYSDDSGTMLATSRVPGRIFSVNTLTGQTVETGQIPGISPMGMANLARPLHHAPLSLWEYHTVVTLEVGAKVETPDDEAFSDDSGVSFEIDTPASAAVNTHAEIGQELIEIEQTNPWQDTHADGFMDGKVVGGAIDIDTTMYADATGDDAGVAGVTRTSFMQGESFFTGQFQVGVPKGGILGAPGLLMVSLALLNYDFDVYGWDLMITNPEAEETLLAVSNEVGTWTVLVFTGQTLELDFGYGVQTTDQTDASLDMAFDLNMSTRAHLPEPATIVLLCCGAGLLVLKRRHRI